MVKPKKINRLFLVSVMLASIFSTAVFALNSTELAAQLSQPSGRYAKIQIEGGIVYDTLQFKALYGARNYEPLWINANGVTPRLKVIRSILQKSYQQGFDVKNFWINKMESFFSTSNGMSALEFELSVSEALLRYVRSINIGQVDPILVDDDIKLTQKVFTDLQVDELRTVIENNPDMIVSGLGRFEPQIPLYQTLKNQLATNRNKFSQDQFNKIASTMEKLRWLPSSLGDRYVFVNLAMTELNVIEKGNTILKMKTVNGRPIRRTPMMIDSMKRVEVNPTWTVPFNLAIWDKLPKIKNDIGFLQKNRIKVYQPGSSTPVTDIQSIPWNSFSRDYLPYIFQQQAGPKNVLGKVKFPLTNAYSIYLHDTDEHELFDIASPRLRSSGCIRLQKPMEMAAYLLKDQLVPSGKGWLRKDGTEYPAGTTFTEEILMSRVARSSDPMMSISTIGINVEKPLPVYTAYLTADIDEKGQVRFIADNYKQDARLLDALTNMGKGTPLTTPMVSATINKKLVPVIIRGELGPTQLFGDVVAVRCSVFPYKGCVDKDAKGNESREIYRFKINEEINLPEGNYILATENSVLPGWFEVECSLDELNDCSPIAVNLEIINIPESFASADEIFVYRDMTGIVEQNKMLSQSFHNGQSLTMEAPVIGKNFYTPGINQSDVVQRLNNDFCKQIINNKVLDVAPEVIKYCVGLDNVVGMADYVDLPVVVDSEVAIGSSDQIQSKHKLKVFEFPSRNSEQSTSTLWTQKWVGAPGNWINFEHRRYLVAAPLFPQNLTIERRFVAVLPGQYQILAVDKAGNHIGKLKVKTENIDENYERVARKVMLGE